MKDINPQLQSLLADIKSRITGRAAIIGIGNILRGDDGLGPRLISLLKEKNVNASTFDCGTAPENYIIPILNTACDTIILVDAADLGSAPGSVKVFSMDSVPSLSFSTHNPSPRLFTDLLRTGRDGLNIFGLAIQPKRIALGDGISEEVMASLDSLASVLKEALSSN